MGGVQCVIAVLTAAMTKVGPPWVGGVNVLDSRTATYLGTGRRQ